MFRKEIYTFTYGISGKVFRFTPHIRDIRKGTDIYKATAMSRANIKVTDEVNQSEIEIDFDLDNEFAKEWVNEIVDDVVTVEMVVATAEEDFSVITDSVMHYVAWRGRLTLCSVSDNIVTLTFEDNFSKLRRAGVRRVYSRLCPYMLYGNGCNVIMRQFAFVTKIKSVVGKVAVFDSTSIEEVSAKHFSAGIMQLSNGTYIYILRQNGENLTLSREVPSLIAEINAKGYGEVTLYPGCDRSRETCLNKFNNLRRFGGFPYMATKNIFGKSIL